MCDALLWTLPTLETILVVGLDRKLSHLDKHCNANNEDCQFDIS